MLKVTRRIGGTMEKKKQFEDIEFYNMIERAIKHIVKRYYKNLEEAQKERLIDYCYLYILENIQKRKDFDLYSKDAKFNFYILKNLTTSACEKFFKNSDVFYFSELTEPDKGEPVENNLKLIDTYSACDKIKADELYQILEEFLNLQNITTQKFIKLYLLCYSCDEIKILLKLSKTKQCYILNSFRESFANYLYKTNYLVKPLRFEEFKFFITLEKYKKGHLRQKLQDKMDLYESDFKIYKLLRNEEDITPQALSIGKTKEYLNDLIFHKLHSRNKLYLFEIQTLRKKFYPNFLLFELLEVN